MVRKLSQSLHDVKQLTLHPKEAKLVKAREVKAGMMSVLLGGDDQAGVGVKLLTQSTFDRL